MGGKEFASTIMQIKKKACVEFVPLGITTFISVRLQTEIGEYGYQHIGTTAKNAVTSLINTYDKI